MDFNGDDASCSTSSPNPGRSGRPKHSQEKIVEAAIANAGKEAASRMKAQLTVQQSLSANTTSSYTWRRKEYKVIPFCLLTINRIGVLRRSTQMIWFY